MRFASDVFQNSGLSDDIARLPNFEQGPAQGPNTPIRYYPSSDGTPNKGYYMPETAALPAVAPLLMGIGRTQVVRDAMGSSVNDGTLDAAIRRGEPGLEKETMMNPPQIPLSKPGLFGGGL